MGLVLEGSASSAHRFDAAIAARRYRPVRMRKQHELDVLDMVRVCILLIGLYTHYTIPLTTNVPLPSAPSGLAGLLLLWRRRDRITTHAFIGLALVMLLYVASILCATNIAFLPRRFNGLIQLTYSMVIGYALFLTVVEGNRAQVAALFLTISLIILIGCLLEDYGGLRPISDEVRKVLYSRGVYENDLRDLMFYNRIRPKFFASEPSSVTFCYTRFTFVWLVVSQWRHKIPVYIALAGLGMFAMPGPTLLLMVLLILPYMLFLTSRVGGRLSGLKVAHVVFVAAICLVVFAVAAQLLFADRLRQTSAGNDPSFFYRVQGPALTARYVVHWRVPASPASRSSSSRSSTSMCSPRRSRAAG